MNNRHPWTLKKSKLWGPFWMNWQCCLAGRSKKAARISIFSIAMGADYLFELISNVHWVPQFFMHNKSILGWVFSTGYRKEDIFLAQNRFLTVKNYLHAIENVSRGGTLFLFRKVIGIKVTQFLAAIFIY